MEQFFNGRENPAPAVQLTFKRQELKYVLTPEQRADLERVMAAHMAPDPHGPATVRNVYYDTPTLLMARRSAERPYYKEKLRCRCYGRLLPGEKVFVELKKKCAGVVYKRRAELAQDEAQALMEGRRTPRTQIERELAFAVGRYEDLRPQVFLAYDRTAYFARNDHEFRMTFDTRIRARWNRLSLADPDDGGEPLLSPALSVLEVKCLEGMPLWLVRHLSAAGIQKASCSKYGTAVAKLLSA